MRHAPTSWSVPDPADIKEVGRITRARLLEPEERNALLHEVHAMAAAAMTDYEIAHALGISSSTFVNWQREDPGLRDALHLGGDAANRRVERSLFHKAMGYTFDSEKIMLEDGKITRVKTIEHVPPDTGAIVWWQKNKAGWSDKNDVNLTANVKTEGDTDPRTLAMAILMALRAGLEAPAKEIEHEQPPA